MYKKATDVSEDSPSEGVLSDNRSVLYRHIKQQAQSLTIRRADKQWASELVNHLRDKLLEYLRHGDHPYFHSASVLNSGSYYEMVKIHDPDEFDIMLLLPTPRLTWKELPNYHGLFYTVSLNHATREKIRDFLLEDERTISPTKLMEEARRLVRKFLNTHKVPDGKSYWTMNRKNYNSPAITLVLRTMDENGQNKGGEEEERETEAEEPSVRDLLSLDIVPALEVPEAQGWPTATRKGLDVEKWLGKKTRRALISKAFYFVAKKPKRNNSKFSADAKECWRISFSHIEKEIIKNHGNNRTCCERNGNKCCRKLCLKLLKFLIERLKETYPNDLRHLCSYHAKTVFLHALSARGSDALWAQQQLPECFLTLLGNLEDHVHDASLPHFFVPGYNLFAPPDFPRRSLQFLQKVLGEQRQLGLPVLQGTPPALPLSTRSSITPSDSRPSVSSSTCNSVAAVFFFFVIFICILHFMFR